MSRHGHSLKPDADGIMRCPESGLPLPRGRAGRAAVPRPGRGVAAAGGAGRRQDDVRRIQEQPERDAKGRRESDGRPPARSEHPEPGSRRRAKAAFERVLRSGQFILGAGGPEVRDRRSPSSRASGTRSVCRPAPTGSCSRLMALGIGPGDEVICPSFTFSRPPAAFARRGDAGLHRLLPLLLQHGRRGRRPQGHAADEGDHARPPLRPGGGHGRRHGAGARTRDAGHRGRRAVHGRDVQGTPGRRRSARSGCSASSRRRTWAASATAGCS